MRGEITVGLAFRGCQCSVVGGRCDRLHTRTNERSHPKASERITWRYSGLTQALMDDPHELIQCPLELVIDHHVSELWSRLQLGLSDA